MFVLDKALNLISLAQKAGKIKTGEYLTTKAVKEGFACLVIIAEDTSEKSTARIKNLCEMFDTKHCVYGNKESLGHFTGNRDKSVICITDDGFSKAFLKLLETK